MKIFFPVEVFYPSQAGGPANTVYWLTKNLARRGHESIIVASDKGLNGQMPLNRWLETDAGRLMFVRTRFLHVPVVQTVVSLVNFWKADVVHLSSVFYPAAFITAFAAKALRKKLAWSPRGELADYALNYSGRRKRPILWCIRKFIGGDPLFHSTSDEETEAIRRIFSTNARVVQIPNYVEFPESVPREDGRYLLYIGRLHPKKGLENLLEAASRSAMFRESGYELRIAGKGKPEYESRLRALATELGLGASIQFVGQVEGDEKHKLLADAHFTLMPSHNENFGIVVVESLAQGTPVIASTNTPWESLESDKVGFWVDNSPESLSAAIERALSLSDVEYHEYRSRGRGFAVRRFDIRDHIDEWLRFYGRLSSDNAAEGSAHMPADA